MIAVDWGTTNFRAYLLAPDGNVLDRRSSMAGLLNVSNRDFAGTLRAQVADWLQRGESTIIMCGMVGSRYGWVEAPYILCPAGIDTLSAALVRVPFADAGAWIVPGVETEDADGVPEIMRGEETAALGAMQTDGLICLPGTHSKWVRMQGARITTFSTLMTGELFAALRKHTILSQFIADDAEEDSSIFKLGVEHARTSTGLLHQLFAARTLPLKGNIPETFTKSFLSGLLIGSEVRVMLQQQAEVSLVGDASLCRLYAEAINICGGQSRHINTNAAARGLWLLWQARQAQGMGASNVTA